MMTQQDFEKQLLDTMQHLTMMQREPKISITIRTLEEIYPSPEPISSAEMMAKMLLLLTMPAESAPTEPPRDPMQPLRDFVNRQGWQWQNDMITGDIVLRKPRTVSQPRADQEVEVSFALIDEFGLGPDATRYIHAIDVKVQGQSVLLLRAPLCLTLKEQRTSQSLNMRAFFRISNAIHVGGNIYPILNHVTMPYWNPWEKVHCSQSVANRIMRNRLDAGWQPVRWQKGGDWDPETFRK